MLHLEINYYLIISVERYIVAVNKGCVVIVWRP